MITKPTDEEIIAVLTANPSRMTYVVKNILYRKHPGLETPFVLRRLKALEKAGKVRRMPSSYVRELCWDIVREAA